MATFLELLIVLSTTNGEHDYDNNEDFVVAIKANVEDVGMPNTYFSIEKNINILSVLGNKQETP